MIMSDKVTIRYTGLGPNVHKKVEVSELSEYGDAWEIKDEDTHIVREQDENQEIAEAASAAFKERASDMHGSNAWTGIAEELEADYNLSDDDEEKSRLALRDDESWSEYRERLKSIQVDRDPEEEKAKEKEAIRVGGNSPRRSSALADMMQDRADELLGEEGSSDVNPGEETEEMGQIPPEKAQKAAEAFRASDTNLGVWEDLADELESGATTEELGSLDSSQVDSTTIESIPGGTFMKSDTGEKTTAEVRTTDEEIQEAIREEDTNLRIVEDRDGLMLAKSDDFAELQEQINNL
jgi:hypothetical protein